jgi:hydrogenase nickel incorporation protein HypB
MLETIRIEEKILGRNDDLADENRRRFDAAGTFVITLSGSPGGGKTSLLERVVPRLRDALRVAVVEGDVETERDGRRIAALGVPVTQIVTNGTCHLNAGMVGRALQHTALDGIDLLFLENVGNLVCPAAYGLGEHLRVVVMSMTEGEDKPLKYPAMFRKADAMVLNKIDLVPYVPASPDAAEAFARQVSPGLAIFRTSCTTDAGIGEWESWVSERRQSWHAQSSARSSRR